MPRIKLIDERLTYSVIGAFYEVYNHLGYGFFEAIYANALEHELIARGHHVAREVTFRVVYKGVVVGNQRADMLVDHRLIVENKTGLELRKAAILQLDSYLHASNLTLGLVLHYGPQPQFHRQLNPASTEHPIDEHVATGSRASFSFERELQQQTSPDNSNESD